MEAKSQAMTAFFLHRLFPGDNVSGAQSGLSRPTHCRVGCSSAPSEDRGRERNHANRGRAQCTGLDATRSMRTVRCRRQDAHSPG